nr:VOC family protein [Sphingomonas sp. Y57]
MPDLAEGARFFEAFGLDVREQHDRVELRSVGSSHLWGTLLGGSRKRLRSIRFGAFEKDMPALERKLRDCQMASPEPSSNGLWACTPDGLAVEVAVADKSSPASKSSFDLAPRFDASRGTGPRSRVAQVRPRRLAHLAIHTDDVQAAMDFYARLGIRLSDRSGNDVAFLHAPHGSDHHLIALGRSDGPGLHHSSWDVATIDEVGQGAAQMADAGYPRGWGVGRHVLGSNYFYYVRDPWGSWAEYSADMDFVAAGEIWPAADHPGEDSFFQWGPPPPEDFVTNHETMPA